MELSCSAQLLDKMFMKDPERDDDDDDYDPWLNECSFLP
jgi:hypothetical protein